MNIHILVIDDDEEVRKVFRDSLWDSGYTVDTADSGKAGLELVRKVPYHLIYLDLDMPGMNGVETFTGIRKIKPDVPVYIITAFHSLYTAELSRIGASGLEFDIIKKPVGRDEIVSITDAVIQHTLLVY
jgi:DNA-binding response OmpR family regulator